MIFQALDELQIPDYVELKVTTENIVRATWAFKRKRLVPWWCQSIISGTPLIVYGIRDYDGHVKRIQHVRTDEIPDEVGHENLDKDGCLMFLSDVLSWMKDIVFEEDTMAVYTFQWDPNAPANGVTVSPLRDTQSTFLPDWYLNEMEDYFASLCDQRQSKGQKRKMEDESQNKDRKEGMKDMRKRLEESWPRTTESGKSDYHENIQRRNLSHPTTRRSYDDRDRGKATQVLSHDTPHEGRRPKRESSQRGDFKREHHASSVAYRNDTERAIGTETRLHLGRTSTRDDHRHPSPQFHQSNRKQLDKVTRSERYRREEEDQRRPRSWSVMSPRMETHSLRSGNKGYPFADAERKSEESRVKRPKRDSEHRAFRRH